MPSQPDPYRLRLIKAIQASIASITPSNGYYHDLSISTFYGRFWFGATDPLPMVSILESPQPQPQEPTPTTGAVDTGPIEFLIQGFVEDDPDNQSDPAYKLLAEVRQQLFKERKRYGPEQRGYNRFGMGLSITDMDIGRGIVRPPDDVSAKAYFWLPVTLVVVENGEDPYS